MRFSGFATLALAACALFESVVALPQAVRPASIRPLNRPGIVWSPFGAVPNTCKPVDQMERELTILHQNDFSLIRLYGRECEQVEVALRFIRRKPMQLMVGIYDLHRLEEEINGLHETVRTVANGDWTQIHTVAIGNEFILAGRYSGGQLREMTVRARALLRALGYRGPVVTVNVFYEVLQDPSLCHDSDYIAVNAHAFFDGKVAADQAGQFVETMRLTVQRACRAATGRDMQVYITETGWPTAGEANGDCVPGREQQRIAMASIRERCGANCIHFTAFDETWKTDTPATRNTEKHWGIFPTP